MFLIRDKILLKLKEQSSRPSANRRFTQLLVFGKLNVFIFITSFTVAENTLLRLPQLTRSGQTLCDITKLEIVKYFKMKLIQLILICSLFNICFCQQNQIEINKKIGVTAVSFSKSGGSQYSKNAKAEMIDITFYRENDSVSYFVKHYNNGNVQISSKM